MNGNGEYTGNERRLKCGQLSGKLKDGMRGWTRIHILRLHAHEVHGFCRGRKPEVKLQQCQAAKRTICMTFPSQTLCFQECKEVNMFTSGLILSNELADTKYMAIQSP